MTATANAIAPWQRRAAIHHLAAALAHLVLAALTWQWLANDWAAQWGDQTFLDAAALSLGGTLLIAFGAWLLMALLFLCLVLGALQFAVTAVLLLRTGHRVTLQVFAWMNLLTPPFGTLAGWHALRRLGPRRAPVARG